MDINTTIILSLSIIALLIIFLFTRKKTVHSEENDEKDAHSDRMTSWAQKWATPFMITFSLGALISLGENGIAVIFSSFQHHHYDANLIKVAAILAIAIVGVVGMDLVLICESIEIRDCKLNGKKAPVQSWMWVGLFSFIEACTFAFVAWQLDNPPIPFSIIHGHLVINFGAAVTWMFILLRAIGFPMAGIRLGTYGKKATTLVQIAQSQKKAINSALHDALKSHGAHMPIRDLLELSLLWEQVTNAERHQDRVGHIQEAIKFYDARELSTANASSPKPNQASVTKPGDESGKSVLGSEKSPPVPQDVTQTSQNAIQEVSDTSGAVESSPASTSDAQDREKIIDLSSRQSKVLGNTYELPDGIDLDAELPQQLLCEMFNIATSTFKRRIEEQRSPIAVYPRKEGNRVLWKVSDFLLLYEAGVFEGVEGLAVHVLQTANGVH